MFSIIEDIGLLESVSGVHEMVNAGVHTAKQLSCMTLQRSKFKVLNMLDIPREEAFTLFAWMQI